MKVTLLGKQRLLMAIMADQRLSPTAKNVACVLLNHLNTETLRCDPKAKSIGQQCCVGERTVSGALAELRSCGWLEQKRRRGSSSFAFNFGRDDTHVPADLPGDDPQDSAGLSADDPQDVAGLDTQDAAGLDTQNPAPLIKYEKIETGKLKPGKIYLAATRSRSRFSKAELDAAFSEFWPHYPKNVDKEDARRAHARTLQSGKATNADLILGADRYAAQCVATGTEDRFIKGPVRWLNAGCWADEPHRLDAANINRLETPHARKSEYHRALADLDRPAATYAGPIGAGRCCEVVAHRGIP